MLSHCETQGYETPPFVPVDSSKADAAAKPPLGQESALGETQD